MGTAGRLEGREFWFVLAKYEDGAIYHAAIRGASE
jgi:hypothetical protein